MVLDQCVTWPLVRSLLQSQYLRLVYRCGGTLCPWVVQVQQVWSLIFHDIHRYVGEFLNTEYLIESITMVMRLLGRITIRREAGFHIGECDNGSYYGGCAEGLVKAVAVSVCDVLIFNIDSVYSSMWLTKVPFKLAPQLFVFKVKVRDS